MKTIYSFKEYYNQVLDLAKTVNKDFISIGIEMTTRNDFKVRTYIDGWGATYANTFEDSFKLMKEKINPSAKPDIDVEIEGELIVEQNPEKELEELTEFDGKPLN